MPAIERYDSRRIQAVYDRAERETAGFLILSGEFGLLKPSDPVPEYDHLLQISEVNDLIHLVTRQLETYAIRELVYFTANLQSNREVQPYYDTISTACAKAAVPFRMEVV